MCPPFGSSSTSLFPPSVPLPPFTPPFIPAYHHTAIENDTPSTDDSQATPPPSKKAFKGFGEKPQKREPPPKTKGQVEREKYASAYDSLASKGVPEYAVYIREREGGEKDWKFVGSMAVPRNAKIDQAIYENEVRFFLPLLLHSPRPSLSPHAFCLTLRPCEEDDRDPHKLLPKAPLSSRLRFRLSLFEGGLNLPRLPGPFALLPSYDVLPPLYVPFPCASLFLPSYNALSPLCIGPAPPATFIS